MTYRYFDFWDVLRDNLSKIMIIAGMILIVFGIVFVGDYYFELPAYAIISPVTMFAGIVFLVYGFFLQVGLFSVKWRSINGLGTLLLCAAVAFFALAIVSMQIQLVTGFLLKGEPSRSGGVNIFDAIPISVRPLLPIFGEALEFGAIFLTVSVILKVTSFLRA